MSLETAGDEALLVQAARAGDAEAFRGLVDRYRRTLHAHCYRMLASSHDADDAVQEVMVRAWRGLARFEDRSSIRTWLFSIATNAALDIVRQRGRRELPIEAFDPSDIGERLGVPLTEFAWIGPYASSPDVPEDRYIERETIQLAYIAALQHLPARQRAVFLLCEVLKFSSREVAEMMGSTVAGVNSGRQRARAALRHQQETANQDAELALLGNAGVAQLAERYARAIEEADLDSLFELLTADASWSMPPLRQWFRGQEAIGRFLRDWVFPERWRHQTASANGQIAVAGYIFDADRGDYKAAALDVLGLRDGKIASVTAFLVLDDDNDAGPADAERRLEVGLFPGVGLAERLAG